VAWRQFHFSIRRSWQWNHIQRDSLEMRSTTDPSKLQASKPCVNDDPLPTWTGLSRDMVIIDINRPGCGREHRLGRLWIHTYTYIPGSRLGFTAKTTTTESPVTSQRHNWITTRCVEPLFDFSYITVSDRR
jgi:hypothetical protein